ESEGPAMIDEEVQTTLVQAGKELLFNVIKHAGTPKAHTRLTYPDNCLKLTVEDEGAGFDPDNVKADLSKSGFGLFNIKERIDLIGGRTDVDSVPGQGTIVSLIVPLNAEGSDSLSAHSEGNREL